MDLDWLWPLLVGAALTAATAVFRDFSARRQETARDARRHLLEALKLATDLGAQITDAQASRRFASDAVDVDDKKLWRLSALDEMLPDKRARDALQDAVFIARAAPYAGALDAWGEPAGTVQRTGMFRLRSVLGASLRGERAVARDDRVWLHERAAALSAAWDSAANS